jgi:hypothetical protein
MSDSGFYYWARGFDALAYDAMFGASVFDLPDEEIEMLRELYEAGLSPFEAFDMVTKYEEVKG